MAMAGKVAMIGSRGRVLLGTSAMVFSALYLASDVWETIRGGFTVGQLWLTLFAEAAVPAIVLGMYAVQRPRIGRLGRLSALGYAYVYAFYTFSVGYALGNQTQTYDELTQALSPWWLLHGALFLLAGLGFGYAIYRAGVLPRWTGVALAVGVALVSASQGLPDSVQLLAVGMRDTAFAGMGWAVLGRPTSIGARPVSPQRRSLPGALPP